MLPLGIGLRFDKLHADPNPEQARGCLECKNIRPPADREGADGRSRCVCDESNKLLWRAHILTVVRNNPVSG